ncbi:MAG: hypothetical protein AAGE93_15045 [Bacteroidota bacterium]
MRVIYDPEHDIPHHVPGEMTEIIRQQLDQKFWAARGKTVEQARIEHDALQQRYIPDEELEKELSINTNSAP